MNPCFIEKLRADLCHEFTQIIEASLEKLGYKTFKELVEKMWQGLPLEDRVMLSFPAFYEGNRLIEKCEVIPHDKSLKYLCRYLDLDEKEMIRLRNLIRDIKGFEKSLRNPDFYDKIGIYLESDELILRRPRFRYELAIEALDNPLSAKLSFRYMESSDKLEFSRYPEPNLDVLKIVLIFRNDQFHDWASDPKIIYRGLLNWDEDDIDNLIDEVIGKHNKNVLDVSLIIDGQVASQKEIIREERALIILYDCANIRRADSREVSYEIKYRTVWSKIVRHSTIYMLDKTCKPEIIFRYNRNLICLADIDMSTGKLRYDRHDERGEAVVTSKPNMVWIPAESKVTFDWQTT